jgi:hypothetical protein
MPDEPASTVPVWSVKFFRDRAADCNEIKDYGGKTITKRSPSRLRRPASG